jgi:twinkle protein
MDMIFSDRDISQDLDVEQKLLDHSESQYVIEPKDVIGNVVKLASYGSEQRGESLPWSNVDQIFRLRPGELTIWGGHSGSGKSNALGQAILWAMKNKTALVASLEMKPQETLLRMISQRAGCHPGKDFIQKSLHEFTGRMWIYDQLDTVPANRILALVHYAAKELKVNHIVIDSLMKCGFGYEDYSGEKAFVDRLQNAAKKYNTHIHLVCHVRKGENEHKRISKADIRGGGVITDICDNVIMIQRNKLREQALLKQSRNHVLNPQDEKALEQPAVWFSVEKNRHGRKEGTAGLYFHEPSGQLISEDRNQAMLQPF